MLRYIYTTKRYEFQANFNDPYNLILFGDIHRDTNNCDTDRWLWFLKNCQKLDQEKTLYLGLGDYLDFAARSENKTIKSGGVHDQTLEKLDYVVQRDIRKFAKEISFMQGRMIGMIEGNHYWRYIEGKTSTEDLCERMQTDYLGWLSHISIKFNFDKNKTKSKTIYIIACHGRAGGKTAGVTINQVSDMKNIFPVADIYVMGHDHQRGAWPQSVLVPDINGNIKQKRQFLCRSGAFLKSYVDGESTYSVKSLYKPSDLGGMRLMIGFHRDRTDGNDTIVTDINAII